MDRQKTPPKPFDNFYQRTQELPSPEMTKSFLAKIPKSGVVLDFGAGTGRWAAAFLRDRPDIRIDAIDKHIDRANLLDDKPVHKIKVDFETFTPDKSYDGVWAFATLFFLKPDALEDCFQKLAGALKKGGAIEFSMVDNCYTAKEAHFTGMTKSAIEELLEKNGLIIESLKLDENARYGQKRILIPTFDIRAVKPVT